DTVKRARDYVESLKDLREEIYVVYFDKEGLSLPEIKDIQVERAGTLTELIEKLLGKTKNM
ncbi:MAG: hypothetical protein QXR31_04075, partial [Zestosphaera sp.]